MTLDSDRQHSRDKHYPAVHQRPRTWCDEHATDSLRPPDIVRNDDDESDRCDDTRRLVIVAPKGRGSHCVKGAVRHFDTLYRLARQTRANLTELSLGSPDPL